MARPRGEGSIWQRQSDGLWIGAVDLGYMNGKRRRKRVSAKSRPECARRLRAAQRAVEAGDVSTSSMRLEAWLRYWLDEVAGVSVKPSTLVDYRSKTEKWLIPVLGKHRIDRLTPVHVRDLHRAMRDGKASERTIRHVHYLLAGSLGDAMTHVSLSRNVAKLVDPPQAVEVEERGLTLEECRRVLDHAHTDRGRWLFALYTGARQGECLGLRWEYVDLDARTAELVWSLQRIAWVHGCLGPDRKPTCGKKRGSSCPKRHLGVPPGLDFQQLDGNLCLVRPKTKGSRRQIALAPGIVHALRELQAKDGPNPHGLVWHRTDGRPLDPRRHDYLRWRELLDAAEVPALPLHSARHTAATIMQDQGVPEAIRMHVLGHTLAQTTRGYSHVSDDLSRAAMESVAKAIEG